MVAESRGTLAISIDLELEVEHHSGEDALESLTARLVDLLARYQTPATFAVADPARSAATETILAGRIRHEMAVLGDVTWIGPGAGRQRLARELDRRFQGARSAGLNVSTLALRHVEMAENLDLLAKNAITLVRSQASPTRHGQLIQPQLLRHGVWQAQPSLCLPQPTSWWFNTGRRTALQLLKRAALQGETVQLLFDGARLIAAEAQGLVTLERILAAAQKLCEEDRLSVVTLQELATWLSRPREAMPQRSILKAA